jgi:predicted DNA-binding ribbon-helix-helix protein
MDSRNIRKSLKIGNRDVVFSIEHHFWICLEEIARGRATTAAALAASIAATQPDGNLSAVIRTYVIQHFQRRLRDPDDSGPVEQRAAPVPPSEIDLFSSRPRWLN